MPRHDQRFYFRDLAAAAGDSSRDPHTFSFHLRERTTIAVERCFQARESLPPLDHHIDVLRIEFQSAADALRQLSRGERRPAANGDNTVTCTYGGLSTPTGDLITVQK
jgi:hypothetical protein